MGIPTAESGRTTRPMATAYTTTPMEPDMKETGPLISRMDMAKNSGQINHFMKELTLMERNTA